ncbi:MAG: hypothetical protein FWF12_03555 [Betaproteobacteria bacterium]|nr:hypothetical protein [Betaproteobacteria bacterium]
MVAAQARQGCGVATHGEFDLRAFAVQAHFAQRGSACLLAALFGMDAADRWAADYDEGNATPEEGMHIRVFLAGVGQAVERGLPVLDQAAGPFMDLVAYLTTSRCIYLLRYVAQHNPAFMSRLMGLIESGGDGVALNTVRQRLVTLAKNEALARIFSPQAMDNIVKIMRSYG